MGRSRVTETLLDWHHTQSTLIVMSPAGSPFICTFHTHTFSLNNAPGPLRLPSALQSPLENGIGFSSPNYNQTGVSSKAYFPSIWM